MRQPTGCGECLFAEIPMAPSSDNSPDSQPRPARGDSVSRRVLEDVLKQTASLYSFEPPTDPGDLVVLKDVARRHPNAPFSLDPVAVSYTHLTLPTNREV